MFDSGVKRRDFIIAAGAAIVAGLVGYSLGSALGRPAEVREAKTGEKVEQPKLQKPKKERVRVAIVTFLSGPASIFGEPSKKAAELIIEKINAGNGILGAKVEPVYVDESGSADKQVAEYRRLVQQERVDFVVGYVSSGHCLAIAPVAEEEGTLTIFYDCATKRLVDEQMMRRLVFRTATTTLQDGVALAQYVVRKFPDVKTVAGINQNYAYGQDEWADFISALKKLKPDIEVVDEIYTPLFTTDYSAQIERLKAKKPDLVHTSFWGPDLVNFVQQASQLGLFKVTRAAFARGESMLQQLGDAMPEGALVESPNYFEYPDNRVYALMRDFAREYRDRYGEWPNYPAIHMATALMGLKAAVEAAAAVYGVEWPEVDEVSKVFERLAFQSVAGYVVMRPDHNAVKYVVVGVTRHRPELGFRALSEVEAIPPELITPPLWTKSTEWIGSWEV